MTETHESSSNGEHAHPSEGALAGSKISTESHLRSILKALSWRIVATCTTILLAWLFTDNVSTALKIGFTEFFLKFLIYYLHERAWQLAPRGTVRKLFSKT